MRFLLFTAVLSFFAIPLQALESPTEQKKVRPNILVIVADDMGYTDVGAFGGEISTPTIDSLAAQGIRFTNFHVLPSCAPTRSVLLTGTDNHTAGLGAQILFEGHIGQPGYEGYLSDRVVSTAEVLGDAGYHTYMTGKWHLGVEDHQSPHARGFQDTFILVPGGGSHFSDQLSIHPGEPVFYRRNGEVVPDLPESFYSTTNYTDEMLSWLERDKDSEKPFFAYLAYTAPHDPLHAPKEYIQKYHGNYDAGYESLRNARHKGMQAKGIVPNDSTLPKWPSIVTPWDDLPEQEKANRRRDMETYAAMVDIMDEQIGRLVQWLKDNNQYDNTLIVFMSDNGANAFPTTAYVHDGDYSYFEQFDNSLENRGSSGSFTVMGAGWATASSAGLRLFKAFSTEGGIRTPAIVKPVGKPVGKPEAGTLNSSFVHVSDLMPTFLDAAEVTHPASYKPELAPMQGHSLAPLLAGEEGEPRTAQGVGYELHATQAYFKGDWKILKMPILMGTGRWELFNLKEDPWEQNNLAVSEQDKLAELIADYTVYEKRVGVLYALSPTLKKVSWLTNALLALAAGVFSVLAYILIRRRQMATTSLALVKILGAMGLFSVYFQPAAWLLIATALLSFIALIIVKAKWIVRALPVIGALLIAAYLWIVSGQLLALML